MKILRLAMALAVGSSTAPALHAATEFEDSIPLELAEIFLGLVEAGSGAYSDIMDGFPVVDLPASITVLGSLERPFSQTVYLRTSIDSEAARTLIADEYVDAGWLLIPSPFESPGVRSVGFTGNLSMPRSYPATVCHEDLGVLQVDADPVSGFTLITLSRSRITNDPRQSCTQMRESRLGFNEQVVGIRNTLQTQLPRLELPDEAVLNGRRSGLSGGISTRGQEVEAHTPLETALSLEAIHVHFASQIDSQGWEQDSNWTGNLIAGSAWTRKGEDDSELAGIFTVVYKQDNLYELNFRLFAR